MQMNKEVALGDREGVRFNSENKGLNKFSIKSNAVLFHTRERINSSGRVRAICRHA